MQNYDIKQLMTLDWHAEIDQDPDGGFVMTVQGLDDFAVFGRSRAEVRKQFKDALRSHLEGYLAVGKVIAVPVAGRVVEHAEDTAGVKTWKQLGFDASTGRIRSDPATV